MTLNVSSYDTLTRDISGQLTALRSDLPGFMKGFGDLSKASLAPGALSEKTKELIAMGGGPSLMYSASAMAAFAEFTKASEIRS